MITKPRPPIFSRTGQMVLFTSPEDMIVGQSVTLQHRQEVTSATAAQRLRTVNTLVSSSLDYEPAKVSCMTHLCTCATKPEMHTDFNYILPHCIIQ